MDVGKKYLIMAIIGTILSGVSSPFVISMIFMGHPFITYVEVESWKNLTDTYFKHLVVNGSCTVIEILLDSTDKEDYKVYLNVDTNTTVETLFRKKDGGDNGLENTFYTGNNTAVLQINNPVGNYVLEITDTFNKKAEVNLKIIVSWRSQSMKQEERIDILRTVGFPVAFIAGIALLIASLIRLRKAAREAIPATKEAAKPRYIEVEEEEEE
ncbi:MAG: hypothetical protein ACUVQ0_02965 [Thermoproteota archaeon]